ncbi:hypothetical protein NBRC116601_12150 [Cognatishimia sp. WU-CL00825]
MRLHDGELSTLGCQRVRYLPELAERVALSKVSFLPKHQGFEQTPILIWDLGNASAYFGKTASQHNARNCLRHDFRDVTFFAKYLAQLGF